MILGSARCQLFLHAASVGRRKLCAESARQSKLESVSTNGATETLEIERKYEVSDAATLPDAAACKAHGLYLGEAVTTQLRATYFDTPAGELAGLRMALRQRVGGKDEGWHLKIKSDGAVREMLWPLGEELPDGLRAEVEDRLGAGSADRLGAIATLDTSRITVLVTDSTGNAVIEIADDRVQAVNELSGRRQSWREWEAELIPDADEGILDTLEPVLTAAGASRVRGTSKIQRAMRADSDTH